ncbi:DUF982 domain-containing protein [Rhizobium sp. TH2]|uniref:DUF982 domain-containing protein n=1 Tax=Rhizobium sp. TH2 TaxID=2775403 RepID=UPI002157CE5D|nr:DUF982 domain-containing protein [Rhizobium sp. TH2]UVC09830.1 DUF982 domain-containing protein [Rhizobium sp. TH2]
MKPDTFDKPVRVLVGLGAVREIRNVLEAYMFLNDAPGYMRNPAQRMALNACKAALLGEIEAETARGAFEAFASKHDLIAPETDYLVEVSARRRGDPHIH